MELTNDLIGFVTSGSFLLILTGVAMIFYWLVLRARRKNSELTTFAETQGGSFRQRHLLTDKHAVSIENTNVFDYIQLPKTATHTSQEYFSYGKRAYFTAEIPFSFGHIFIKPKASSSLESASLQNAQIYSTEGIFGDCFDAYFLEGKAVPTLQFLDPMTMEFIVHNYSNCMIELIHHKLIVTQSGENNDSESVLRFIQSSQALADELIRNHDRKAQAFSLVKNVTSTGQDTHLKKDRRPIIAIVAAIGYFVIASLLPHPISDFGVTIGFIVLFILVITWRIRNSDKKTNVE